MLTKLPESGAVPVVLVWTGERALGVRCDDLDGFRIVLPRYKGKDGGEGGTIGGPVDGWIVTRKDGCIIGVGPKDAVPVAALESPK